MSEEKGKFIDWGKIITNAVSAVVTMIVVGACLMVYRAAMSVDDRVNDANRSVKVIVNEVQKELVDSKAQINELVETVNKLREEIARLNEEMPRGRGDEKVELKIVPLKPTVIPKHDFLEQRVQETAPRMFEQMQR